MLIVFVILFFSLRWFMLEMGNDLFFSPFLILAEYLTGDVYLNLIFSPTFDVLGTVVAFIFTVLITIKLFGKRYINNNF